MHGHGRPRRRAGAVVVRGGTLTFPDGAGGPGPTPIAARAIPGAPRVPTLRRGVAIDEPFAAAPAAQPVNE